MKRAPWLVFCLFLASPLIGEYLLGSLPARMIFLLPLMAAMYGSAAILIREIVRRTGRGWPSIFLLAIAYGFLEEGFVTQSLFNANYLHLRLLDYGWLPQPGTALPWLLYVVGIHAVWSISVPIALTEAAFPRRREQPWIKTTGLVLYSLLFVVGCALIATFTFKQVPFMASPAQLAVTAFIIVALCVIAMRMPHEDESRAAPSASPSAPRPLALFLASLLAGSLFMQLEYSASSQLHWNWIATVLAQLLIVAAFIGFIVAARIRAWSDSQYFALAAGAFVVYVWKGFETDFLLHGSGDLAGHSVIAVIGCALLAFVGIRVRSGAAGRH
jgi:hypothetical protein